MIGKLFRTRLQAVTVAYRKKLIDFQKREMR